MPPVVPVLLAGGEGKRLGPLGEARLPKQFHDFGTGRTLLQHTAARALQLAPAARIVTVTAATHEDTARQQLRRIDPALSTHLLAEPLPRNTGAAVTLAALYAQSVWDDATLCILPCDHWVEDAQAWQRSMEEAIAIAARNDVIVLFGVTPREASDQFGYILPPTNRVGSRFVEKPSCEEAIRLITQGALINSGMFVMRVETCLQELRRHARAFLDALQKGFATDPSLAAAYASLPPLPIDRVVMEKTAKVRSLTLDCGWADLGRWEEINRVLGTPPPSAA